MTGLKLIARHHLRQALRAGGPASGAFGASYRRSKEERPHGNSPPVPTVQHEALFEQTMATNESLGSLADPYPVILSEERIAS